MKKHLLVFTIIFYIFISCVCPFTSLATNNTDSTEKKSEYTPLAKHLILADISSDYFMFERNSEKSIEPSGFTKILTAITVLENTDNINKKITVKKDIFEDYNYANKSIGLKYGEKISIRDLLKAMLVYDAGDCAIALAHSVGESYDSFITLMNDIAKKAGAENSVFVHPAGFKSDGQATTLKDLYYITKYALKNETFAEIVNTKYIEIEPTNLYENKRTFFNTNEFLNTYYSLTHYNPKIRGVKAYTNDADNSGVIANYADANNNLLILCAVAPTVEGNNMAYEDVNYLINYANEKFTSLVVVEDDKFMSEVKIPNGKYTNNLLLVNDRKIKVMLPKNYKKKLIYTEIETDDNILAPIKKGDILGKVVVYYDNQKCGEANLLAYSDVKRGFMAHVGYKFSSFTNSGFFKFLIIVFLIALIIVIIRKNTKKEKRYY